MISIIGPSAPGRGHRGHATWPRARANVPEPYRAIGATVDGHRRPRHLHRHHHGHERQSKVAAAKYANAVANRLIAYQPKPAESGYELNQLSPADTADGPVEPRAAHPAWGRRAFGVILGIFAAMWAAGVRRRLSRVTEVKERIGATVLGEIPRVGDVRAAADRPVREAQRAHGHGGVPGAAQQPAHQPPRRRRRP